MTTAISIRPTYRQRYARNRGDAAHPGLWDGMVGHFAPRLGPTGGTLFDNSPLRNHGVLTNMENADDWSPASDGWNLNFGGTDEYVTSPSITAYDLTTAMSVCADFVITGNPVTTNYGIVYRGSNAAFGVAGNRWYFYSEANAAGGLLFLGSKVGASSFTTTNPSGFAAQASTRYRVAATFDNNRSTKWRFYINGLEYAQATPTDNGAFASAANPLRIGNLGSGGSEGNFLVGSIYELAIYNRAIPDDMGLRWSMGVSPLDMKSRLVPVYVPQSGAVDRTATDSLTTSESVTRVFSGSRTTTDAPAVSESVVRVVTAPRTTTDASTVSESVTRVASEVRTVTAAPTVSESVARAFSGSRTTTDAPTVSESVVRGLVLSRSATEGLSTSESVARSEVLGRTVTETPQTSESVTRAFSGSRSTTDAPQTSESVTRSVVNTRSTTDAPQTSESLSRTFVGSRTTTDSVQTSESADAQQGVVFRSANETLTITDSAGSNSVFGRTVSDSVTVAESINRVSSFNRAITDSLSALDSVSRLGNLFRLSSDGLVISVTSDAVVNGGVVPDPGDVRFGVSYDAGNLPDPGDVRFGVVYG